MATITQTKGLEEALAELQKLAPDAPFLALGQTVFWDEPMKAGLALASTKLGYSRKFVAGVHDTDYFAKLSSGKGESGSFKSFPHNDTTTKGLWSAAGEFSALFGSETVVTREVLAAAGLNLARLGKERPDYLNEATEAWGWRGIVSLSENAPITAQLPISQLFPSLIATLDWAIDLTLSCIGGQGRDEADALAERLREIVCEEGDAGGSLADFYKRLLPKMYSFVAGRDTPIEATTTSELLKFNPATCGLPRFDLLRLFVEPTTREIAGQAYDEAIFGTGLYGLSRFGTGAIPFDLVIPGVGRGTIRIGTRGIVIGTPDPQFISIPAKRPLKTLEDLAELVAAKFGQDCALVGKAVTLIGMMAREHVFVFHEGASSYVRHSRRLHETLAAKGYPLTLNPILRLRYDAWSALQIACTWLRLPEPFQRPFGTEELCAPSFASRWKQVVGEQRELLRKLSEFHRPIDLIRYLAETSGGSWNALAKEYESLRRQVEGLTAEIGRQRAKRQKLYKRSRELKVERVQAERAKGEHFRAKVLDKQPSPDDLAERERLTRRVEEAIHQISVVRNEIAASLHHQRELVKTSDTDQMHESRRRIELEIELKRTRLVRQAVICSDGLIHANHRPSGWWFNLVCPDGLWYRQTMESAECYLEPLI